jgi:actin-related protein
VVREPEGLVTPTSSHAACRTPVVVTRPDGSTLIGRVVFVKGRPSTGKAKVQLPSGSVVSCPLSACSIHPMYDGVTAQHRLERLASPRVCHTSTDDEANR